MELSQKNEACIKRLQMLENEGAHVEEHIPGKISSSMSVMSAETVGTAGSVQSNSTWSSIFRAYGWKLQEDEEPPTDNAKFDFGQVKERELYRTHDIPLLQVRDSKVEHGQLEKLELVPSTSDGDAIILGWPNNAPPDFSMSGLSYRDQKLAEKVDALIALIEEREEKDEIEETEIFRQKLSRDALLLDLSR